MQDLKRQVGAELSQSNFFEQQHTTYTASCKATRSQVTLTNSWQTRNRPTKKISSVNVKVRKIKIMLVYLRRWIEANTGGS